MNLQHSLSLALVIHSDKTVLCPSLDDIVSLVVMPTSCSPFLDFFPSSMIFMSGVPFNMAKIFHLFLKMFLSSTLYSYSVYLGHLFLIVFCCSWIMIYFVYHYNQSLNLTFRNVYSLFRCLCHLVVLNIHTI